MFKGLIDECRMRFAEFGWHRSLFGKRTRELNRAFQKEGIDSSGFDEYRILAESGVVVWSSFAQANAAIYSEGKFDLPGNTAFSLDPAFDARPHLLLQICERVFELKNTEPGDIVMANVAAILLDEQNMICNWRIPRRLTYGYDVFLTSTLFHRCRLPGGFMNGRLLPLVVAPGKTRATMLVPLSCWPEAMIRQWPTLHELEPGTVLLPRRQISQQQLSEDERDARERPHRRVSAGDIVPDAARSRISLTPACVAFIRELVRQQKLRGSWWLKIGGTEGAWTMDIITTSPSKEWDVTESQGVKILTPGDRSGEFMGLVVDYQSTAMGKGFVFYSSASE